VFVDALLVGLRESASGRRHLADDERDALGKVEMSSGRRERTVLRDRDLTREVAQAAAVAIWSTSQRTRTRIGDILDNGTVTTLNINAQTNVTATGWVDRGERPGENVEETDVVGIYLESINFNDRRATAHWYPIAARPAQSHRRDRGGNPPRYRSDDRRGRERERSHSRKRKRSRSPG
jgi:hypothetical protein